MNKHEMENFNSLKSKREWVKPTAFHEPNLSSFPIEAFPDWIQKYVSAEATATQTPPDLSGVLVLAVLATACARKIRVLRKEGHDEPTNLYVIVAMESGSGKSPVFRKFLDPILQFESAEKERMLPDYKKLNNQKEQKELILKNLKRSLVEQTSPQTKLEDKPYDPNLAEQIDELSIELERFRIEPLPQYTVDDCTPERLSTLLAQHGRMAVMSAEGGVFDIIAGRYSGGMPNLDVYLKGYSGDFLRIDREKDGKCSHTVSLPALTFALTVQPCVITGLANIPEAKGKGLLARFLYSLPKDMVGNRVPTAPPVPGDISELYKLNLKKIFSLPWGAGQLGEKTHHLLRFSEPASQLLDVYQLAVEERLKHLVGKLWGIRDWGSKLTGSVIRMAGLLHVASTTSFATPWNIEIEKETVENAIKLADYFEDHAIAAFAQMGADEQLDKAKIILDWIEKKQRREFPAGEIFKDLRGRNVFRKMKPLRDALDLLVEHNYLFKNEPEPKPGPGRRKSETYEVNPYFLSENTQNPLNVGQWGSSDNFRDFTDFTGEEHPNV